MGYFDETLTCSCFLMNEDGVKDLSEPETLHPATFHCIAIIKLSHTFLSGIPLTENGTFWETLTLLYILVVFSCV